jgi:hypothetical protein
MSIFSKSERKMNEAILNNKPEEEWVWVEGFKGMDKDMKCRGHQFQLGRYEVLPDNMDIRICESGFHFCLNLKDVFSYYDIEDGNRFFKVRALVRREDLDKCLGLNGPEKNYTSSLHSISPFSSLNRDKLTSKQLVPLYELTPDEVFSVTDHKDWSLEDKLFAMQNGIKAIDLRNQVKDLIQLGYSKTFAYYIATKTENYELAKAIGSQKDLSMDMKALMILEGNNWSKRRDWIDSFMRSVQTSSQMTDYYTQALIDQALQASVKPPIRQLYKIQED